MTIWIGVFPISIDGRKPHWIALAMSIQTVATHLVLYYVRHPNHAEALWFANVANQLLWWTYIKVRAAASHDAQGGCGASTPPAHNGHLSCIGCCTAEIATSPDCNWPRGIPSNSPTLGHALTSMLSQPQCLLQL